MNRDFNKIDIADSFLRSIETYELHSTVQRKEAERLVRLCKNYLPPQFNKVLEVGCGTGLLTRQFVTEFTVENLILADLSEQLCKHCKTQIAKSDRKAEFLAGDIEQISIPEDFELIISSSSLQWLSNLEKFFERCSTGLKEEGYLVFSLFIRGTMKEINELTGRGLSYFSKEQIAQSIERNFTLQLIEENSTILFFNSVKEIVQHIRNTGVGAINQKPLTISQYKEFEKEYERRFKTDKGIPVSYNSVTVIARKDKRKNE